MSTRRIPKITHLQFLVLGQLRGQEQAGRVLREALAAHGVRRSAPAFYQLMARLMKCRRPFLTKLSLLNTTFTVGALG